MSRSRGSSGASFHLTSVLLFCAFMLSGCGASHPAFYQGSSFDPSRSPEHDLTQAIPRAKDTGQRILLYVGGDWCGWCWYWNYFVKTTPDVYELLHTAYLVVPVYSGPHDQPREFLSSYPEFTKFPQFIVLESNGTYVYNRSTDGLESTTEEWSFDHDEVMAFLKAYAPSPLPDVTPRPPRVAEVPR